jgi:hypothetical protein
MCALSLIRSSSWSCKSLGCGFSVGKADSAVVKAVVEAVVEAVGIYYD